MQMLNLQMQIYFRLLESNPDLLGMSDVSVYMISTLISLKEQELQPPQDPVLQKCKLILGSFLDRIKNVFGEVTEGQFIIQEIQQLFGMIPCHKMIQNLHQ